MAKVLTRIQWHTEENGVLKWRNPGDITEESVPDLDDLIRAGTVEVVAVEIDPAPTLKSGKRGVPSAPESEG